MNNVYQFIIENVISGKVNKEFGANVINMINKESLENHEDIAIVGMSSRFPMADNKEIFWNNIKNGVDCIVDFPKSRELDVEYFLDKTNSELMWKYTSKKDGKLQYNQCAYLNEIDKFDYKFFKLSPKEASLMDPNQRLFLETAWEAIEDAGYGGEQLRGSKTGVYIGFSDNILCNYLRIVSEIEPDSISYGITGNIPSIIASRIAYLLDLKGPSICIDTACSSSLVAVHLACQAIKNGDCNMALVGGSKVNLLPINSNIKLGVESSSGKTRSFDDYSDGVGSGEGVAAILLKPLNKAISDNDNIYAVIKGSAINQDGKSVGITAPNPAAQEEVLVSAWNDAQINPETISYIETHGTGTKLGDPIEIEGIHRAFERYTNKKQFCAIGSVKTNIGHLDSAAGMAGLIKSVLALRNKKLPPHINFNKPNRIINFYKSPVYINDSLKEWKSKDVPRRCGVSSFGISGTNCHVVLEEFLNENRAIISKNRAIQVFTISAKSKQSLIGLVHSYNKFFENKESISDISLEDICYTTNTGRGHYNYRIAIIVRDKEELIQKIKLLESTGLENISEMGVYCKEHHRISSNAEVTSEIDILDEDIIRISELANEKLNQLLDNSEFDEEIFEYIAKSYIDGAEINWFQLYCKENRRKVALPVYSFEKTRCWLYTPEEAEFKKLNLTNENSREDDKFNRRTMASYMKECLNQNIELNKTSITNNEYKLNKVKEYAMIKIVKLFKSMEGFEEEHSVYNIEQLKNKMKIIDKYNMFFKGLIDLLERENYLKTQGLQLFLEEKSISVLKQEKVIDIKEIDECLVNDCPELIKYVNLVDTCINSYKEVLTGNKLGTEVLFSDYLYSTVEEIYKEDANVNVVSKKAANCVKTYIERRIEMGINNCPIKILEVGAGYGATSIHVFEALKGLEKNVEYYYTDISLEFVNNAKSLYGEKYSFIKFKKLNIEKDIRKQGFDLNSFDVILAANSMHATSNIRNALYQTKKLMNDNAILLLVEGTKVEDFALVTYGLLESYWNFTDSDIRFKFSHLISKDMWNKLLKENGFIEVSIFSNEDDIQSLIYAENDSESCFFFDEALSVDNECDDNITRVVVSGRKNENYTEMEKLVADTWSRALGFKEISVYDNFYELGGDSIIATKVTNSINNQTAYKTKVSEVLRYLTIKEYAEFMETKIANSNDDIINLCLPVKEIEESKNYPVSASQKRMYIMNQVNKENVSYNISQVIELKGTLDISRLHYAIEALVNRHEILRTSFEMINDEIVQIVHDKFELNIDHIGYDYENVDDLIHNFIKPFDLNHVPLLRVGLISIKEDNYILIFDIHHIISDGTSLGILVKEFMDLYEGNELPVLIRQYKDFSSWHNALLKSNMIEQQKKYWEDVFSKELSILNLPIDYHRPANFVFEGDTLSFKVEKDKMMELKGLAINNETTLYSVLLTAYYVLLFKYTNQEDIVVGTPVTGRRHIEFENTLGMFINTIALRNFPKMNESFNSFLREVKENVSISFDNQDYQFEDLVDNLEKRGVIDRDSSRNALFDTMFILQNFYMPEIIFHDLQFIHYRYNNKIAKFDLTLQAVEREDGLYFDFEYCTRLYKKETIERMAENYVNILTRIIKDSKVNLSEMKMLNEEEKRKILYGFNNTNKAYPKDKLIYELFEEQVKKTPNSTALVFGHNRLTYKELNSKANQLARVIREEGIKPNNIVGILMNRSIEMIISLYAVLKAGGAYLPIDPEYPEERIQYMIEDSGACIILKQSSIQRDIRFNGKIINFNDSIFENKQDSNLDRICNTENLIYMIYTSGTTGKPKGAMIKHGSFVNLINWFTEQFDISKKDKILLIASTSFDLAQKNLYSTLIKGGELCLFYPGSYDYNLMSDVINNEKITIINCTPSSFQPLLDFNMDTEFFRLKSLRKVFLGGESINPRSLVPWVKSKEFSGEIVNTYGPTECTDIATFFRIDNSAIENMMYVPIGKPIYNTTLYILDKNSNVLPIGSVGELYIGGDGIGNGYINAAELTAEKFIEVQGLPDKKVYKTGDLVKWNESGNVEYIGRVDNQVKIRGYRIELEEIEKVLLEYGALKDVVVVVIENNCLCAYYVSENHITSVELREYLLNNLPNYMIPSYFIRLEKMPITPNGKVDRKKLPKPEDTVEKVEYVSARNRVEEILITTWQDVLNVNNVGINDNFFTLGGDSIKAIQVSARIQKYILKLDVKDLFQYPTICKLSSYVKLLEIKADQGSVVGRIELTPIQRLFFDRNYTEMYHNNQSVMLYNNQGFNAEIIRNVVNKIVEHHDALRMIYNTVNNEVVQYNRGTEVNLFTFAEFDFKENTEYEKSIYEECNKIQASIDLNNGPLIKIGLFKTNNGDHLLITIHHLAIDGISWRIILEDFINAHNQIMNSEEVKLQEKTNSFKEWSDMLRDYANSKPLLNEAKYWIEIENNIIKPLPQNIVYEDKFKDSKILEMNLSKELTENLLKHVNKAYNTEINDILLAALGLAVKQWTNENKVLINLEGHGREQLVDNIDISRTIGWFTSMYPIILDIKKSEDLPYIIKNTKETLRKVPNKGIGYGILKYLTSDENRKIIDFKLNPEICFNYLGQFDADIKTNLFDLSSISYGSPVSPNSERNYAIEINGVLGEEKLFFTFNFNKDQFQEEVIVEFMDNYEKHLKNIIEHCAGKDSLELTPSDFMYKGLSIEELQYICGLFGDNLQEICSLSHLQQGMMFHSLLDNESFVYFEQVSFSLNERLDFHLFKDSFNMLIEKYDIFRANFIYENLKKPVQVILKHKIADMNYVDISHMSTDEKYEFISNFKESDKKRGFDLQKENLMRCTVLKIEDDYFKVVWSYHHILMDGWSTAIIMKEFLSNYEKLKKGILDNSGEEVYKYPKYLEWLENQDKEEALDYWKKYLDEYEQDAGIPTQNNIQNDSQYIQREISFKLGEYMTSRFKSIASVNQVTLNTLFQGIWSILLQKYNDVDDVLFGTVVSGRSPEVKGIEEMIGLFINTIPVRIKFNNEHTFSQLLNAIQEAAVSREKYSHCSLQDIQSETDLKRKLINHIIVFENYAVDEEFKNLMSYEQFGSKISEIEIFEQTNYNFNVIVAPGNNIEIKFVYNATIYDGEFVSSIIRHFSKIIDEVFENNEIEIKNIDIIPEEERRKIVTDLNNTENEYQKYKTINELFEQQVDRTPNNIAVIYENNQLTYEELNIKSNQLARVLREKGVTKDVPVGIMVERSLEMLIGIFGILKAGGAYLPIDPKYPADRIEHMLEDSNTKVLLVKNDSINNICFKEDVINLDDSSLYKSDGRNLDKVNDSKSLAYIIYTSGSTGNPKGVMIEHHSVVNRLNWMQRKYPIDYKDTILQKTTFTFDVSVWEIFWWSFFGAKVCLLVPGGEKDPELIIEAIEKNKITTMHFVPSMLNLFLDYINNKNDIGNKIKTVKQVFSSGEALKLQHVEKFDYILHNQYNSNLINLYGPTEATVDVSYFNCYDNQSLKTIPIGKPIDNTKFYVISKNNQLQPIGAQGELWISGVGVARGYLNKKELTNEKFCENPFIKGERVYKTGDLVRLQADGNIEFLGRIDHQVKIRGFRIELEEIDNHLLKHQYIKDAVSIVREDTNGNNYICTYIDSREILTMQDIKEYLLKKVPEYMIPAYFTFIDSIPVKSNGKVDKKLLPLPNQRSVSSVKYSAPENETERLIAQIWADTLNMEVEKVGTNDNFFDIGGNSLKLVEVYGQLEKQYPGKFKLIDLFSMFTIKKISEFINKKEEDSDLKIQCIKIPNNYFSGNIKSAKVSTIGFEIKGDLFNKINYISNKNNVTLDDLFLAMYIYLFNQISEMDVVTIQTMNNNNEIISPIAVDFKNIDSITDLLQLVKGATNSIDNKQSYKVKWLNEKKLHKTDDCIVPFFTSLVNLRQNSDIMDVFDIVLKKYEEVKGVNFKLQFNSTYLKKDKIEELAENYLQLIKMLTVEFNV